MDETVGDLIRKFPCAFANRTQALHHVLVVLGCGYRWQGGELVYGNAVSRDCLRTHQFVISEVQVRRWRELGIEVPEEVLIGTCPAEGLRSRAAVLAVTPGPLRHEVYPAGPGSNLLTVPPDVTADWRAAVEELAGVVVPAWRAEVRMNEYCERRRCEALRLAEQLGLA
ncbi:hypothetical protein ACWGQ5_00065 [Streptomyces sp. NPDC055722]